MRHSIFFRVGSVSRSDDANVYTYTGNDPPNGTDPTGEADCNNSSGGSCDPLPEIKVEAHALPRPMPSPNFLPEITVTASRLTRGVIATSPVIFTAVAINILLVSRTASDDTCDNGNCNTMSSEDGNQQSDSDRNPADDQKLTPGEIDKLKGAGHDPEEMKGGKATGKLDLYKDKKGNIYIKPKGGSGPGEPTGININKP